MASATLKATVDSFFRKLKSKVNCSENAIKEDNIVTLDILFLRNEKIDDNMKFFFEKLRSSRDLYPNIETLCKFTYTRPRTAMGAELHLKSGREGYTDIAYNENAKTCILNNKSLRKAWENLGD